MIGINARQIKLFQESGISTAEALAMSPHNIISEIDGIGDKTAKKLIWNARNALGMTDFIPAEDIYENTEYITTGSSGLNRILGGGFQTGKLTEVYGPFKSGKTNFAKAKKEKKRRIGENHRYRTSIGLKNIFKIQAFSTFSISL